MMRKGKRKPFLFGLIGLLAFSFIVPTVAASWVATYNVPGEATSNSTATSTTPVAYYNKRYFSTVEGAVASAYATGNSQTVYVIPGTNPVISESFTIESSITLNMPYEGEKVFTEISKSLHNSGMNVIPDTEVNRATYLKNTLTLSAGVEMTIKGKFQIGAIVGGAAFQGGITNGSFTQVLMKSDSKIIVDGGTLNCYGYIKEETIDDSLIEVKNTGSVLATLAIADYPGSASNASSVASKTFPFDFYDMRCIHSKLIFDGSCTYLAHAVVFGTNAGTYSGDAKIIGTSDSLLIPLDRNTVVEWHYVPGNTKDTIKDDTKRKTYVSIYGGGSIDKIKMSLGFYSFNSATFDLPISSYFDFNLVEGDYSLNEKTKFLPGSKVIVSEDANLTVNKQLVLYEKKNPTGTSNIYNCSINDPAKLQVYGTVNLNSNFSGVIETINDNQTGIVNTGPNFVGSASTIERSAQTTTFECNSMQGKISLYNQSALKQLSSSSQYFADGSHWDGPGGKYPTEVINVNESISASFDENKVINSFVNGTIVEDSINLPTPSYEEDEFDFLGYYLNDSLTVTVNSGQQPSSSISSALDPNTHKYIIYARWALKSAARTNYRIDKYNGGTSITSGESEVTLIDSTFTGFTEDTRAVVWGQLGGTISIYKFNGWVANIYSDINQSSLIRTVDVVNSSFVFSEDNGVVENGLVVFEPKWDTSDSCSAPSITLSNASKLALDETVTITATVTNFFEPKFDYIGGFESADEDNIRITTPQTGSYVSLTGTTAIYESEIHNENTTSDSTDDSGSVEIRFGLRAIIDVDGIEYSHDYGVRKNYEYQAYKSSGGGWCLLPETLVTMADGSYKMVKDVIPGDMIRVFNHETGMIDVAPVTFNDFDPANYVTVINLNFSNGHTVGVISEHGFFDLDTMRYEYITEDNYSNFIGHKFYVDGGSSATLDSVTLEERYTEVYSPTSFYHLDLFVEDMLSMPGGISGLFNIFEYDSNLQYEQTAYQNDIETYGLFTYEDLAPLGVTEIMFEAYAGQYLKVALGKGILTMEYLEYLIERYGHFTD